MNIWQSISNRLDILEAPGHDKTAVLIDYGTNGRLKVYPDIDILLEYTTQDDLFEQIRALKLPAHIELHHFIDAGIGGVVIEDKQKYIDNSI
jgi:hypothetical protein